MWARVVEFMLGCWLAVSPFVFQHGDDWLLWAADFIAALIVVTMALISYWPPMRHAHLGTAVLAVVMMGFGRIADGAHPGPGYQNYIVIGLLLAMFAIVPNYAGQPPLKWFEDEEQAASRV